MSTDRRDVDRILEAALDEPGALAEADLDRALELLESDAKRVRVGAAWAFGIVADDDPGRVMPYVPRIAELLAADAVAATTVTGIRQVLQLCFIILLSLSMRELHYRLPYRDPESTPISHGRARFLEAVFIESTRRKPTALAVG